MLLNFGVQNGLTQASRPMCRGEGKSIENGCRCWEADIFTAFESEACGPTMRCCLSKDDALLFGMGDDVASDGCPTRNDVTGTAPEDPQLCRSSSEQTQVVPTDPSCLLEEALSSIGMRQLLPQFSMSRSPADLFYGQMQMASLVSNSTCVPYSSGAASVFVPCTDPPPAEVCVAFMSFDVVDDTGNPSTC